MHSVRRGNRDGLALWLTEESLAKGVCSIATDRLGLGEPQSCIQRTSQPAWELREDPPSEPGAAPGFERLVHLAAYEEQQDDQHDEGHKCHCEHGHPNATPHHDAGRYGYH